MSYLISCQPSIDTNYGVRHEITRELYQTLHGNTRHSTAGRTSRKSGRDARPLGGSHWPKRRPTGRESRDEAKGSVRAPSDTAAPDWLSALVCHSAPSPPGSCAVRSARRCYCRHGHHPSAQPSNDVRPVHALPGAASFTDSQPPDAGLTRTPTGMSFFLPSKNILRKDEEKNPTCEVTVAWRESRYAANPLVIRHEHAAGTRLIPQLTAQQQRQSSGDAHTGNERKARRREAACKLISYTGSRI